VTIEINVLVVTLGVPLRGRFLTFARVFLISATEIISKFALTISSQPKISNGVFATIDVVSVQVDGSPRFFVHSGVFRYPPLGVPVLLTRVLVSDLVTPRSVQMEGAKRVRLAIDLVSIEVNGVSTTPIVPRRPFLEYTRFGRFAWVSGVIVKLPPIDSEIIVQTFLAFGDALP